MDVQDQQVVLVVQVEVQQIQLEQHLQVTHRQLVHHKEIMVEVEKLADLKVEAVAEELLLLEVLEIQALVEVEEQVHQIVFQVLLVFMQVEVEVELVQEQQEVVEQVEVEQVQ